VSEAAYVSTARHRRSAALRFTNEVENSDEGQELRRGSGLRFSVHVGYVELQACWPTKWRVQIIMAPNKSRVGCSKCRWLKALITCEERRPDPLLVLVTLRDPRRVMARPLRLEFEGALYHLTPRGNERRPIFRTNGDRQAFLDFLGMAAKRFGWSVTAWVLMTNHFHLIIQTPQPNLSRGMHWINSTYAAWFNRVHKMRTSVPGAVQDFPHREGGLLRRGAALYGAQPGAREDGGASRELQVVELPGHGGTGAGAGLVRPHRGACLFSS